MSDGVLDSGRCSNAAATTTEVTDDEILGVIGASQSAAPSATVQHRVDPEADVKPITPIKPGELQGRCDRTEERISRSEIYVAECFRLHYLNKNHMNEVATKILRHGYSEHSGRLVVARVCYLQ